MIHYAWIYLFLSPKTINLRIGIVSRELHDKQLQIFTLKIVYVCYYTSTDQGTSSKNNTNDNLEFLRIWTQLVIHVSTFRISFGPLNCCYLLKKVSQLTKWVLFVKIIKYNKIAECCNMINNLLDWWSLLPSPSYLGSDMNPVLPFHLPRGISSVRSYKPLVDMIFTMRDCWGLSHQLCMLKV